MVRNATALLSLLLLGVSCSAEGNRASDRHPTPHILESTPSEPALRTSRPIQFHLAESKQAPGLIAAKVDGEERVVYLHPQVELEDRIVPVIPFA